MKPIYLLCLHGHRTGGPEAIHQLSDALIEQGFDARLIYYRREDIIKDEADESGRIVRSRIGIFGEFPEYGCPAPEYEHYRANVVRAIDISEPFVIVLPEIMCHLAALPKFAEHTVLVWWLSVDNGLNALSSVNLNHLRKPHVIHAAQSQYALDFIRALHFHIAGDLTDYTTDLREHATPLPWAERKPIVILNNNKQKVIADLEAIANQIHDIDPDITVHFLGTGNPRPMVAKAYAQARVFVDLGCFPGKDRMAREAASMGCDVITGLGGGSEDVFGWRAASEDVVAKLVVSRMRADGPPARYAEASPARERAQFFKEVVKVFAPLTDRQTNSHAA